MYCGQCGTPNPEDAGTCERCGAPLLVTLGSRSCVNCGSVLGDHDRFCTTCGTPTADNGVESTYNPADDFGELDIDDIQLDELPDWLQSMAPSSPSEDSVTEQALPTRPDQPSPDDLPDWLRESPDEEPVIPTAPTPPPTEQLGVDHQPADQFSLVSDEDLPDWLKALSDEEPDPAPHAPTHPVQSSAHSASGSSSTAVANLFEVPPVSRAWLTQGRTVDEADISAARQEFSPLETVARLQDSGTTTQSIWDADPMDTAISSEDATRPFTPVQEDSGSSIFAGRGQLIARIVILVLLVIVIMILGFVLIQAL